MAPELTEKLIIAHQYLKDSPNSSIEDALKYSDLDSYQNSMYLLINMLSAQDPVLLRKIWLTGHKITGSQSVGRPIRYAQPTRIAPHQLHPKTIKLLEQNTILGMEESYRANQKMALTPNVFSTRSLDLRDLILVGMPAIPLLEALMWQKITLPKSGKQDYRPQRDAVETLTQIGLDFGSEAHTKVCTALQEFISYVVEFGEIKGRSTAVVAIRSLERLKDKSAINLLQRSVKYFSDIERRTGQDRAQYQNWQDFRLAAKSALISLQPSVSKIPPQYRRNADESIQRGYHMGDRQKVILYRYRAGQLTRDNLLWAASLGDVDVLKLELTGQIYIAWKSGPEPAADRARIINTVTFAATQSRVRGDQIRLMISFAATCIEHVLPLFETISNDMRPRNSLMRVREWANKKVRTPKNQWRDYFEQARSWREETIEYVLQSPHGLDTWGRGWYDVLEAISGLFSILSCSVRSPSWHSTPIAEEVSRICGLCLSALRYSPDAARRTRSAGECYEEELRWQKLVLARYALLEIPLIET